MWMSEEEIRVIYRQAKDQRLQVCILAELNLCSKRTIRQICGLEEKPMPKKPGETESKADKIERLLEDGISHAEIAKQVGCHATYVRQVKNRLRDGTVREGQPTDKPTQIANETGGNPMTNDLKDAQTENDAPAAPAAKPDIQPTLPSAWNAHNCGRLPRDIDIVLEDGSPMMRTMDLIRVSISFCPSCGAALK